MNGVTVDDESNWWGLEASSQENFEISTLKYAICSVLWALF